MKTIIIRLPDVEAAMLLEVQKVNKAYTDLQGLLVKQIREEYEKNATGKGKTLKTRRITRSHYFCSVNGARIWRAFLVL